MHTPTPHQEKIIFIRDFHSHPELGSTDARVPCLVFPAVVLCTVAVGMATGSMEAAGLSFRMGRCLRGYLTVTGWWGGPSRGRAKRRKRGSSDPRHLWAVSSVRSVHVFTRHWRTNLLNSWISLKMTCTFLDTFENDQYILDTFENSRIPLKITSTFLAHPHSPTHTLHPHSPTHTLPPTPYILTLKTKPNAWQ